MKFSQLLTILVLSLPLDARSDGECIPAEQALMQAVDDLHVPNSAFSLGICYLAEPPAKDGIFAQYHRDLVVLKEGAHRVASHATEMPITVGRISDLVLEKNTDRFVAISYGAGEFCNGIVIFDTNKRIPAASLACVSDSDICHVTEIDDRACIALVECRDMGAEGEPPTRNEPVTKRLSLCEK